MENERYAGGDPAENPGAGPGRRGAGGAPGATRPSKADPRGFPKAWG